MREVPKSGPLVLKGGGGQLTPLTPPLATGLFKSKIDLAVVVGFGVCYITTL